MINLNLFRVALVTVFFFKSLLSLAQDGVNVHHFDATANTDFVFTETSQMHSPLDRDSEASRARGLFSAFYDYQKSPFVEIDGEGRRSNIIVNSMHALQLSGAIQLSKKTTLFANIPLYQVDLNSDILNQSGGFSLGDLRTFLKFRITDPDSDIQVSAIPELYLPLSEHGQTYFVSGQKPGLGLRFGMDKTINDWRLGAHVGAIFSPNAKYKNVDYNYLAPIAFGVSRPVTSRISLLAEMTSAFTFASGNLQNIFQAYVGGKYLVSKSLLAYLQVGTGRLTQDSALDYRIVAGLKFPTFFTSDEVKTSSSGLKIKDTEEAGLLDQETHYSQLVKAEEKIEKNLKVEYKRNISFKHDKSFLDWSAQVQLLELANYIKPKMSLDQDFKIKIIGYTSQPGDPNYNVSLSRQRALNVKNFLISKGISPNVFEVVGAGSVARDGLLIENKKDQELVDRRVEILIYSKDGYIEKVL